MEEVLDRVAIADGITADLQAMDKEDYAPPPETEVETAPEEVATEPQAETPDPPAATTTPEARQLADTDLVIDPADGQAKQWGEVKAERLRHADYTRKTMELAEGRREVEAMRAQFAAQQKQAELLAKRMQLPQLPEDDPYAQTIKAQQESIDALAEYQQQMQQQMAEQLADRELAASRMALEAEEARLATAHGLDKREIELVEREYWHRARNGENITLDAVAKEHKAYVAALEEAAVKKFKEKHRTGTPAAKVSTPAAASNETEPVPGSRAHRDKMREEIAALMG